MISHRISTLIASGVVLFAAAAAMSPTAQAAAPDRYAVIAYSPVTG